MHGGHDHIPGRELAAAGPPGYGARMPKVPVNALPSIASRALARGAFALALAFALLAAPLRVTAATTHERADAIAWVKGDVEGAFATAKREHKPVLLYWGAVWCPPCQQLKSTVFNREDFIARTRLVVPVYLDGDEPGAQKWGDRFRVSGYPTLLVLDADKRELMRLSGGMDLEAYARVLDNALADAQPVAAILQRAVGGAGLDATQCRRLAYNAWELDLDAFEDRSANATLAHQLEAAATRCPADARLERLRLKLLAVFYALHGDRPPVPAGQPDAFMAHQLASVDAVMAESRIAVAAFDVLRLLGSEYYDALRADTARQQRRLARYSVIMDAAASDARYGVADQLLAIRAKLAAAKADEKLEELPLRLVQRRGDHLVVVGGHRQGQPTRSGQQGRGLRALPIVIGRAKKHGGRKMGGWLSITAEPDR